MTEYRPDKFVVLRIEYPEETLYKVFGTWSGGYTTGDSWRMNSGISKVEVKGVEILFHGYSGSVYHCHEDSYGTSAWTHGVLQHLVEGAKVPVQVLDGSTNWRSLPVVSSGT